LGMVAHTCIRSNSGAKIGSMVVWGQPGQTVCKIPSQPSKSWAWCLCVCHPSYTESISRRVCPGKPGHKHQTLYEELLEQKGLSSGLSIRAPT
jgi:hypothetical protein